ncbi:MAG: hypothetical protein GIW97_03705 [Candidatus Eremiobacteraeota bacterium]|nr:hypothetical protein [Candidatus Eremiobacteraeota bacterium]
MKILDRYLLRRFVPVCVLLDAVCLFVVPGGEQNIALLGLPATMAALICFRDLSRHGELLALHAAGVSLRRIATAPLLFVVAFMGVLGAALCLLHAPSDAIIAFGAAGLGAAILGISIAAISVNRFNPHEPGLAYFACMAALALYYLIDARAFSAGPRAVIVVPWTALVTGVLTALVWREMANLPIRK